MRQHVTRFAFLAATLAACGDSSPPGTARFSTATIEQRTSAVALGIGHGSVAALGTLFIADLSAQSTGCPSRSVEGDRIVYDAGSGCTAPDGTVYAGRASAANGVFISGDGIEYDPTMPTSLELTGFSRTAADGSIVLDGTLTQDAPIAGGALEMHLRIDQGVAQRVDLTMSCTSGTQTRACTVVDGSRGEIDGLGSFAIRGEIETVTEGMSGWLELEGQDTLRLELAPGRLCNPMTVDGSPAGEICREEPPPAGPKVSGGFVGCNTVDGVSTIDVAVWVEGEASRVYVDLGTTTATEQHELTQTSTDTGTGEAIWGPLVLTVGTDTQFTCAQYEELGAKATVVDASGATTCGLLLNGTMTPFAPDACQ